MSQHLDPRKFNSRTTDHSDEIRILRSKASDTNQFESARIVWNAAAALLEVHDATGISLDDWTGPKELVEFAFKLAAIPAENFLVNEV